MYIGLGTVRFVYAGTQILRYRIVGTNVTVLRMKINL
jgi:hypothetical protein